MNDRRVVVVGAGPAGVASALALKDVNVPPLLVDRADQVGASWRARYDRLRLNSNRFLSHLPDRRFPKGTPTFPTRDQLVEHLERGAHEDGIELQLGTTVEGLQSENGGWRVRTAAGDIRTPQVIVATGYEGMPVIPEWDGRESFRGEVVHSHAYCNPAPFAGKKVLVVGSGCSGMEIAYDLAEGGAGKVWLSARTPPNIVMREGPAGLPGDFIALSLLHTPVRFADAFTRVGRRMDLGDLTEYGLPIPDEGVFSRLHRLGVAPAILDQEVIDAIKDGRIEVVRGVESLEPTAVHLARAGRVEPEVLICATGYRPGLEALVGHLDVLDDGGKPSAVGKEPAAPGLRFIGYVPRPAALGYMSKEAKRAAKAIARELRDRPNV